MSEQIEKVGIIADAMVLIDYAKSAPYILQMLSQHFKKLYVAVDVLNEVDQLGRSDVEKLGIEVVEPTFSQYCQAIEVIQIKRSLSKPDAICYVLAKDNNWDCLTNEKPLRSFCSENKVELHWGIGIMHHLISAGHLDLEKTLIIIQDIASKNPRIPEDIVERFKKQRGL